MLQHRIRGFFLILTSFIALGTQALPDLVVSSAVNASPNPVVAGNSVTVSFTVRNQGTTSAGATTTRIQIKRNSDNATFADQNFATGSIPAGGALTMNSTLTVSSSAAAGAYTVYVVLDRYSAITQSNTSNDYANGALNVTAPVRGSPDLIVSSSVGASPNPAVAGSAVTVSFTVRNQGTANAGASTTRIQVKRNSDSATFADQDVATGSVSAGSALSMTSTLTVSSSATAGSYTVYVTLDRYNVLGQSNTGNDYASGALSVATSSPTITSVSPNSGSTAGGDVVTILGTNLKSASSVTFGGTSATVAYNSTTGNLQPTTPPHAAGTVSVSVTTPGGTTTLPNAYTYVAPVKTGTLSGTVRDSVTNSPIAGASVSFNGWSATTDGSGYYVLTNIGCVSSTLAVSKAGYQSASMPFSLVTCPGTTTKDVGLNPVPTITSVSPNSGSTAGGDVVTILGTNLKAASSVTFGGTSATVAYNSTTGNLQPTTPAHAAGTVSVSVTTPGGTTTLANAYTYVAARTLSYIQVSSGPGQVNENSTAQYVCTATYNDGTSANVTTSATWSINSSYASIASGTLTTHEVPSDQACQITVTYGGKSALANITIKNVSACTFSLSTSAVTLPATGGAATVQVTASTSACTWTPVKASDGSWLAMTPSTQQTGSGTITVSAPANPSTVAARTTTISVGNLTLTVTQPAAPPPTCTYTLTPPAQTIPPAGGSVQFQLVATNAVCTWTATLTGGSWAAISGGGSGTGNGTITVSAPKNPSTTSARTMTLAVGSATATISQPASTPTACTFSLSTYTVTLPANGGAATVQVTASASTCTWTPVKASDGSWLAMTPSTQQIGNGTISLSAPLNSAATSRSTTLTVGGNTVSVTQLAATAIGILTGTVRDVVTNSTIAGAAVTFNGVAAQTDATGTYRLSNVACVSSMFTVTKAGYQPYSVPYSIPSCSGTTTKNVQLQPIVPQPSGAFRTAMWIQPWDSGIASIQRHGGSLTEANPAWYALNSGAIGKNFSEANILTSRAALTGTQLLPTIQGGMTSNSSSSGVLGTATSREAHANEIVQLVLDNSYDGIDIDYEDRTSGFNDFIELLGTKLHAVGRKLSVSVFSKQHEQDATWQDWARIGAAADWVKIMVYPFSKTEPVTPLAGLDRVAAYADQHLPARKIMIGLPWYGVERTDTGEKDINSSDAIAKYPRYWYSQGSATYVGGGVTAYFEDEWSFAAKLALLHQNHPQIAAVSIWAAGWEGENTALWDALTSLNAPSNFTIVGTSAISVAQGSQAAAMYALQPTGAYDMRADVDTRVLSNGFSGSVKTLSATATTISPATLIIAPTTATQPGNYYVGIRFTNGTTTHLYLITVTVTTPPGRARTVR